MSGACTKPVPVGEATWTSTTCPSGTSRLGQAVLVPVGQVVIVLNLSHWDWERSKEACPCPMDTSYTHAGGLSLLQDKLFDHDGTCPSPTCTNLSHKVGLQGRGKVIIRSVCQSSLSLSNNHGTGFLVPNHTNNSFGTKKNVSKANTNIANSSFEFAD
jgi:hypothetical protein